jgi:hypothetical protein
MALWAFLSLLSTFVLPQLLGVLLYFQVIRFSKWLAFVLGVLVPGFAFFFVGQAFFFAGIREVAAKGEMTCGMPAVAAGVIFLLATAFSFVVAFLVQLGFLIKRR